MVPDRIGRYRIEGKLGTGGMGEVYRAWDEDLDRRVAIKLIRAGAESARSRKRFRREARMVAALDHPAIVRIHDILPWKDRDCIVMEYVEGRTLTELVRGRPLDIERALALALEITGGLAAAHARSIVHRDLKADNVMVTSAGHPTPGRAKILDFGLAKQLASESREPTVSVEGTIVGTYHSMSPEQIRGTEVDCRSDLFSLGTLLYQMATGEVPFRGDSADEILAHVLTQSQPPARQLNPEIPQELSELIDRLLEKPPDHRPQSAEEVIAVLEPLAVEASGSEPFVRSPAGSGAARATGAGSADPVESPTVYGDRSHAPLGRRKRFTGRKALVVGALVALVAAAFSILMYLHLTTPRPSVAVLGLENRTGRDGDAWLSTAISEILAAELAAGDRIRIVGRTKTVRVMNDLRVTESVQLTTEELTGLRLNLDAKFYVVGSYTSAGENLRLELHLRDAAGEVIESSDDEKPRQRLFELVDAAAVKLRDELGAGAMTEEQKREVEASYPGHPEAARLYADGLDKLRRFSWRDARESLEQAVEIDPHPLSYRALAAVHFALGFESEAREAAQHAKDRAAELPRRKRRELAAYFHEINERWEEAAEIYHDLWQEFDDDVDAGLQLALAQINTGKPQEALDIVADLRRLSASPGAGAEIDLVAAKAHQWLGDLEKARAVIGSAVARAENSRSDRLVAEALFLKGDVLDRLAEYREALEAINDARVGFEAVGDKMSVAATFELMAVILVHQRHPDEARRQFELFYRMYRDNGNDKRAARGAINLGATLSELGRHREAIRYFEQGVKIIEGFGENSKAAAGYANWGTALQETGALAAAQEKYEQAYEIYEEMDRSIEKADTLTNIGEVMFLRGDLTGAQESYQAALVLHQDARSTAGEAYVKFRLGELLTAKGELSDAEHSFGLALKIQRDRGIVSDAALTKVGLAELEIHQDNYGQAQDLAEEAEKPLAEEKMKDEAVMARIICARALLERQKWNEARELVALAESHSVRSENFRLGLVTKILAARLRAESDDLDEIATALRDLEAVAASAAEADFVVDNFEARFALGVVEMKTGRAATGRARLEALAAEAGDKGFGLIVDRVNDELALGSG